jgi:enoyl-CoA hydratase/carnithine racemase
MSSGWCAIGFGEAGKRLLSTVPICQVKGKTRMSVEIVSSQNGATGEIRFSKPPHNYACPELLRKIADEIDAFDANPDVRCILLSSDGKSFCAGADLAGEEAMIGDSGMDAIAQLYVQAERLFRRKKPMVVVVQGAAIGAGLGLALTGDFRVAGPRARFSANFVRLGFHPGFGLTVTVPRIIGIQRATQMMLTAERVKPETALQWGLVDRLADDEESLLADARAFAAEIAGNAPLALIAVRSTLVGTYADTIVAAMRHEHAEQTVLKATADYEEGVASVFERRDAKFSGQ